MTETLVLAAGAPAAIAAIWLASRRSWSPAAADNRGIALQTVIVIVVMLVIAGGVSAVLLSRGGDVIGDLEARDVRTVTEASCPTITLRNSEGTELPGVFAAASGGNPAKCTWGVTAGPEIGATLCTVTWGGERSGANDGVCIVEL